MPAKNKKILLVSTCFEKLSEYEFVSPVASIVERAGFGYDIINYNNLLKLNSRLNIYSKIIICGTALKDNYYLGHLDKFSFLKSAKLNVLGICSGMQIIGLIYGKRLVKTLEIGLTEIKCLAPNILFKSGFRAYSLHENSLLIRKSKPNSMNELNQRIEILAESEKCVQAIKIRHKNIYGVLFHPEVRNKGIIINFLKQ